jgi:hypothetical protein
MMSFFHIGSETLPPSEARTRRRWLRFSLRSLLLVIMLAGSYCAGWVSHRSWNQRNTQQTIADAIRRIGGPVQIEKVDNTDVLIFRGQKNDVEKMVETAREIDTVARQ